MVNEGAEGPNINKSIRRKLIAFNTAEPPPEVTKIIEKQGLLDSNIEGWAAVPIITPPLKRISRKEISTEGLVDAYELLSPFLGNKTLDQTLRTADILNGCGHHCDTCLADASFPTKMFSLESMQKLFSDERFINMLQKDSLRFGSSGDILDHPQAIDIVKTALQGTVPLDKKRVREEGKRHKIRIFTNYRPNTEKQIDELIELARQNPERIDLCLSLPFNKKDEVNIKFQDFVKARPQFFGEKLETLEDGMLSVPWGNEKLENVTIQDVRHPRLLFMVGRVLSKEANAGRVKDYDMVEADRDTSFRDRGLVKTYLNPDALWLMIYTTPYESHTGRVFTPITPSNLEAFSHLPYHYDFSTPPNWPGGKGEERDWQSAGKLKKQAEMSDKQKKSIVVVH